MTALASLEFSARAKEILSENEALEIRECAGRMIEELKRELRSSAL